MLYGRQGGGWWLNLFQPGDFCNSLSPTWVQWKLDSAPDQYGLVGRLAFEGHVDDAWNSDLILCTRTGTRDGLVAYSRSQLTQAALANMPAAGIAEGPALSCGGAPSICPVFAADTHPEFTGWTQPGCGPPPCGAVKTHFSARVFNLDCDTFRLFDPSSGTHKWVSATACGYHSRDPNDPFLSAGTMVGGAFYEHCMLVLHDLTTNPNSPHLLAKLYGTTSPGNATDVKAVTVGGSEYVVATDFAGHVQVFDVTGAFSSPGSIITPVSVWTLPLNPYDGLYDNASELEIDQYAEGGTKRTTAYVACYRRGVEVLDLTNLPTITRITTLDTPGIAEGVKIRRMGGTKRLLVACRAGGVQIFSP